MKHNIDTEGGRRLFAAGAPIHAKSEEAEIHTTLAADLSLQRSKSDPSPKLTGLNLQFVEFHLTTTQFGKNVRLDGITA